MSDARFPAATTDEGSPPASAATSRPRHVARAVLLGASNVARGLPVIVDTGRGLLGGPVEVLAACGRGRSYGLTSQFLGRTIGGLARSRVWDALDARQAERDSPRLVALVTDVGNDLLYGASVWQIVDWVAACLERLDAAGARTVVTALPLENLRSLGPRRFAFFRSLFFPFCRLSLAELAARAHDLGEQLERLAAGRPTVAFARQRAEWFGVDPIHITFARMGGAWRELLASWADEPPAAPPARLDLGRWVRSQLAVPAERRVFGIAQRGAQPCLRWPDGTTVALY